MSVPGSPADPVAERPGIADVATPSPEAIEDALGLGAAELRAIQEGLAAAGFDPGGADGLFGAGTRTALEAWQRAQGIAVTGYLTEVSAAELRAAGVAARAERPADVAAEETEEVLLEVTEPGCEQWNTAEYFLRATAENVTTCLAAGADVESRDDDDWTPLHVGAELSDNPAVLSSLIDFGDDSGDYALDGDCDDTRFGGDRGSDAIQDDSHIMRDATDCRNLLNEGSIFPLP